MERQHRDTDVRPLERHRRDLGYFVEGTAAAFDHRMRVALLVATLSFLTLPAGAQEMIEVPTDPNFRPPTAAQVEPPRAWEPPTVPAPSSILPIPPPVLAPPPAVTPFLLPRGAYRVERNYDVVVGGGIMFGVAYSVPLIAGAWFGSWYFAVPLAGPLLQIAAWSGRPIGDCRVCGVSPFNNSLTDAVLVLVTLAQVGGIVLSVAGLKARHRVWRPLRAGIAPTVTRTGAGIGLRLSF